MTNTILCTPINIIYETICYYRIADTLSWASIPTNAKPG